MMLALLIYCYANGRFSSRRIERATCRDVAVRYLTADTHPDHDTIGTFRRINFDAIAAAWSWANAGPSVPATPDNANPTCRAFLPRWAPPTAALADCGFADKEVFERLQVRRPAQDRCVSVHREDAHAERRDDFRPLERIRKPEAIKDPGLQPMADKLQTPEGKTIYRQRASTVAPVFGIIKAGLGFRQFLLRGLAKVCGEWNRVCLAYNLKRLHRLGASETLAVAS